jgi:hypothetical protein
MEPLTGQNIIDKFEVYLDDTSELSAEDELDLADDICRQIYNDRPWEFLKKPYAGTTDGTNAIALPTDFGYLLETEEFTDNSRVVEMNASPKTILVGGNKYQVVNFSDRRQYANRGSFCYVDLLNKQIVFTVTPASGLAVDYDYIHVPAKLTLETSPAFPAEYHSMVYHGMAVDDYIIQQFDKAKSYLPENQAKYQAKLANLVYWNAQFYNN